MNQQCTNELVFMTLIVFFFSLPLTLTVDKELNLVRCGTCNLFGLVGDIPPQGEQPTFEIIIA